MQPIFLSIFIVYHTLRQCRQKTSCRAKFSATAGHKKSSGQLSPSGDFRNFSHRQFQFLRCGNLSTSRVYKMRFDLFDFLKLGKQLCRQWNFAAATDSHNQSFFHPCTIPASMLTAGVTQSFQKIAIGKIKTIAGIISATGNCLILHILKPVASMIKPPHALKSLMM